jgi:hypothetical protein
MLEVLFESTCCIELAAYGFAPSVGARWSGDSLLWPDMAGTKAARKVDILEGKTPQRTGIRLYAAIEREVTMLTASREI